jgi:hypothetical protein
MVEPAPARTDSKWILGHQPDQHYHSHRTTTGPRQSQRSCVGAVKRRGVCHRCNLATVTRLMSLQASELETSRSGTDMIRVCRCGNSLRIGYRTALRDAWRALKGTGLLTAEIEAELYRLAVERELQGVA